MRNDRLGEKRLMNCGMEAEIITYNNSSDINIKFEDGTIVENRSYRNFRTGQIANPQKLLKERLGEKKLMNCGMEAKIVAYRNAFDLDVQFDDGYVVKQRTYHEFKDKHILNPNIRGKLKRLGEKHIMHCGMEAEIIRYRNCSDVDIRFDDGTLVKHKTYGSFVRGNIRNPNYCCAKKKKRDILAMSLFTSGQKDQMFVVLAPIEK